MIAIIKCGRCRGTGGYRSPCKLCGGSGARYWVVTEPGPLMAAMCEASSQESIPTKVWRPLIDPEPGWTDTGARKRVMNGKGKKERAAARRRRLKTLRRKRSRRAPLGIVAWAKNVATQWERT